MEIRRFSHIVIDKDGFALRKFTTYADAKWFVSNKPEYMVKKINFNLDEYEECLF
ncbi:MAG: hypothetical protein ACO3UU_11285 [Minisyncoccia bacterium]